MDTLPPASASALASALSLRERGGVILSLVARTFFLLLLLLLLPPSVVRSAVLARPPLDSPSRAAFVQSPRDLLRWGSGAANLPNRSPIRSLNVRPDGVPAADVDASDSPFQSHYPYPLDSWQTLAGASILSDRNVIVTAPTGAGKTAIAEMAVRFALSVPGRKAIYTTPLKALSNQKFIELRKIFGASRVGLLTGDMSVNRDRADVVVMTTEVYRNMAWRASVSASATLLDGGAGDEYEDEKIESDTFLSDVSAVVLDEFHYMGAPGRGGVWEESVVTGPAHVQLVCLSATMPNAVDICGWMRNVTGRETDLVDAGFRRPVPLRYMFANSDGLCPLFERADAGPGSDAGLLGYRGDWGNTDAEKATAEFRGNKRKVHRPNSGDAPKFPSIKKLPPGLNINSVLR